MLPARMTCLARFASIALTALALSGCGAASSPPDYPNRTVVVVCPWAAGGGTDRVARFLADQLQRELGQPVVVQNQTGGSGATGHAAGARARPDGYTITMGTFELSTMRAMGISDLTYRDFQPLAQVNADPAAILVRSDSPWPSLRELLDQIGDRPGELKMSGTAKGGAWDLARAGLLLAADLPVDAVNWVPSQGAAPSLVELLGGHIDAVCCSLPEAQSQLEAGQLRVLCVMSAERLPDYPDVPTAKEAGIAWEAVGWRGLFLPRRTSPAAAARLNETLADVLGSAACQEFMGKNGFGIAVRHGDDFTTFLDEQERRWDDVIDRAGYASSAGPSIVATSDPGPWFFPSLLSCLLVAGAGLVATAEAWRRIRPGLPTDVPVASGKWRRFWRERGKLDVVLLLVALPVYVTAISWLGFFASTWLFATGVMIRLGVRAWMAAVFAVVMLCGIYLLFVKQFSVVLPTSPWWPL